MPTMKTSAKFGLPVMASLSDGAAKYDKILDGVTSAVETVLGKTEEAVGKVARDAQAKELTPRGANARRIAIGDLALKELDRIRQERIRAPMQDVERNALPDRVEPLPAEKDTLDADPGILGFVRDRLGRMARDAARAEIAQAARDGETAVLLAVQGLPTSVRRAAFGIGDNEWRELIGVWAEKTRPATLGARRAAQEAVDAVGIAVSAARDWVVQKTGATREIPVPDLGVAPPRIS